MLAISTHLSYFIIYWISVLKKTLVRYFSVKTSRSVDKKSVICGGVRLLGGCMVSKTIWYFDDALVRTLRGLGRL